MYNTKDLNDSVFIIFLNSENVFLNIHFVYVGELSIMSSFFYQLIDICLLLLYLCSRIFQRIDRRQEYQTNLDY